MGTASFGNDSFFTQQRENCILIKKFGPMYIDFGEYPRYSGRNSEIFEKMLMKIFCVSMLMHIIQVSRKFSHGLMRKVG